MEKRKIYGAIIGVIAFIVLLVGATYAVYKWVSPTEKNLNVNLTIAGGIDDLVIYKHGDPILETDGQVLEMGTDYTSGISTTIEFWKVPTTPKRIYGTLNMKILNLLSSTDTTNTNINKTNTVKWTITTYYKTSAEGDPVEYSPETVLATGSFYNKYKGNTFALKENFQLNPYQTFYKVYIWLDATAIDPNKSVTGELLSTEISAKAYAKEEPALTTLENLILMDIVNEDTPSYGSVATTDEGIYALEDDLGMSYYFRGSAENNYVKFGKYTEDVYAIYDSTTGTSSYANTCSSNCTKIANAGDDMYWRIVRINGDGSIRMVYDGTNAYTNGTSSSNRQIGKSTFNSEYYDTAYVGYMYGQLNASTYQLTNANTNNSSIKTTVDRWYSKYLNTNYGSYIANAIYCNDRTPISGYGYGDYTTNYRGHSSLLTTGLTPTLICEQKNDRFTLQGENIVTTDGQGGNEALTYPVGLLSLDEFVLAGSSSKSGNSNQNYYLYTGEKYWLNAPDSYDSFAGAYAISANNNGSVEGASVGEPPLGVRPVISLKADTPLTGTGTKDNPFKLQTTTLITPPASAPETLTYFASLGFEGEVSERVPETLQTGAKTDEGLFAKEDDQGTSYYFRGAVTNNYVKFGKYTEDAYAIYDSTTGTSSYASTCSSNCTKIANANDDMYWRIVRINGDGTIRMIYDGTSPHANNESSENRQIGLSMFNYNYESKAFVGYMYGDVEASENEDIYANTYNSSIKTTIDNWYSKYLNTNYGSYIANAIYCNDRKESRMESAGLSFTIYYEGYDRLHLSLNPSLECEQVNDRFTLQGETIETTDGLGGNQDLTYPVGLLTTDEVVLAGCGSYGNNDSYYLYNGNDYWLGSASGFFGFYAGTFIVNDSGTVNDKGVDGDVVDDTAARPAISLKSDVLKYGDGTTGNPFRIEQ